MPKKKNMFPKTTETIKQSLADVGVEYDPESSDGVKMDFELADNIYGNLPDGAYYAIMEEMTGLEPCDMISEDDED